MVLIHDLFQNHAQSDMATQRNNEMTDKVSEDIQWKHSHCTHTRSAVHSSLNLINNWHRAFLFLL